MVTAVRAATPPLHGTVPRLWPGATIVCLATGPSLCARDVDYCRGRGRVIAIKNAYDLAPWADVVYAAGYDRTRWWRRHGDAVVRDSVGLRFTLDPEARAWATVLRWGSNLGLSLEAGALALGDHSGYSAINLAVLLGAARVVLLGYDMRPQGDRDHFYGPNPHGTKPDYAKHRQTYASLIAPLHAHGVTVINCTPGSAIDVFPRATLPEALP